MHSLSLFFFFKGKYHWKKLISSNYFYITETVLSLKFILPLLSLSSNHPSKKEKKKKVCLIIDKVQFKYSGFQLNGTSVTRNSCLVDQSCKNKRMYIFAPFYANLFKKNGHLWDHYLQFQCAESAVFFVIFFQVNKLKSETSFFFVLFFK